MSDDDWLPNGFRRHPCGCVSNMDACPLDLPGGPTHDEVAEVARLLAAEDEA